MKYGLHVPHFGPLATTEFMQRTAQTAERLGFASLWVSDHVVVPHEFDDAYPYRSDGVISLDPRTPFHDPFALVPWLAGITTTPEIGIGAFVAPYRHPVVTAKLIGTADFLSGGRTRMVAGAGWMKEEFDVLGVPFEERGRITDETLDLLTRAFSEPSLDTVVGPVGMEPRPLRRPYPLMVGGHTKVAMRRALRLGHGWQGTPQHAGQVDELVEKLADVNGGSIPEGFIVATRLHISRYDPDTGRDAVMQQVRDARAPRVDEVVLSIIDPDVERFFARLEALGEWLKEDQA